MKTSTHDGHCQICGKTQRLPGGMLAKHGYQVHGRSKGGWGGYFSGECWGSHHMPYEESCELVKLSIERAHKDIAALEEQIAKLEVPATEPKSIFKLHSKYFGSAETPCTIETVEREDRTYTEKFICYQYDGKEHRASCLQYSLYGDALEIADKLNRQAADRRRRKIEGIKQYIEFQTERVTNWKPAPLIARKR